MSWFAVKSVIDHSRAGERTRVYGERIVLFEAASPESALDEAEAELSRYLERNPHLSLVDVCGVFALGQAVTSLDGQEVFYELFASELEPRAFYDARYEAYSLDSDPSAE